MKAASAGQPRWRRMLRPLLVLLGINALVFTVYTLPRSIQERSIETQGATLRAEAERERATVADLRQRAEALRANAKDAERLYREILGDRTRDLVPTIEEVEKMATDLGLRPLTRSFDHAPVTGLPLVRTVIRLPLRGTYSQLVSFLDRIERSKRFLVVDEVSLRERQDGQADLTVAVATYFRADGDAGKKS